MRYLAAAVVLVGLLCSIDLILTLGVIKRLREHGEVLSRRGPWMSAILPAGSMVSPFTAVTTDGGRVSRDLLVAGTLVGFFTPGCTSCERQLSGFVGSAGLLPDGRRRALAVVVADDEAAAAMVRLLSQAAHVVVEAPFGPVAAAFQVATFPAFCLLDEHHAVVASGADLEAIPAATPA